VRIAYFDAHISVCLEEQYARAQFAPRQLQHWGLSSAAPPPRVIGCCAPSSSSSSSSAASASSSSSSAAAAAADRPPRSCPLDETSPQLTSAPPAPQVASPGDVVVDALGGRAEGDDDVRDAASSSSATYGGGSASPPSARKRHPFSVAQEAAESRLARLPEDLQCSICMLQEANAAIIPCGHAVACVRCIERCDDCPVCRKPIDSILRIYRS
jgi:hypothetical protein